MKAFPYLQERVDELSFVRPQDRGQLEEELTHLLHNESFALLVRPGSVEFLNALYLRLAANRGPLATLLTGTKNRLLHDYFQVFAEAGLNWPEGGIARERFVELAARALPAEYLSALLKYKLLDTCEVRQLQELAYVSQFNIKSWVDFGGNFAVNHPPEHCRLALEMLLLMYPSTLDENTATHLGTFLDEVVPVFCDRFPDLQDQGVLLTATTRWVEWFMVWRDHLLQTEDGLDETDEYFATDFARIVQYVPRYIWWNNGVLYQSGDKNFHFGSAGFRHLALGGSVRNAPGDHPYTRRMAKEFVNLPYELDQDGRDIYIHCFGKSLGAGPQLLGLLQEFMRHPAERELLEAQQQLWNPIIQKLTDPEFENLEFETARDLMGYLYHCLRDQPDFTVARRTIRTLVRESAEYYQRIANRAALRAEREAARAAARAREEEVRDYWPGHGTIKPYETKRKDTLFKIVELTNRNMLTREGHFMHHCVGSYVHNCLNGVCSVWSLREWRKDQWFSLVTIEIRRNRIVQASAKFNARPTPGHQEIIMDWARKEGIN